MLLTAIELESTVVLRIVHYDFVGASFGQPFQAGQEFGPESHSVFRWRYPGELFTNFIIFHVFICWKLPFEAERTRSRVTDQTHARTKWNKISTTLKIVFK